MPCEAVSLHNQLTVHYTYHSFLDQFCRVLYHTANTSVNKNYKRNVTTHTRKLKHTNCTDHNALGFLAILQCQQTKCVFCVCCHGSQKRLW